MGRTGPRTICLVAYSIRAGGAERVLAMLANHWARAGHEVHVVETARRNEPPFFELDGEVGLSQLALDIESKGMPGSAWNNLRRIVALRRELKARNPDLMVSFLTEQNVVALLACVGLRCAVVVAEHTDPYTAGKSRPWAVLRRLVYPAADRVAVLTERAARYFGRYAAVRVIPNPVVMGESSRQGERDRMIVGMGRLVETKRFDQLVRAFASLRDEFPNWTLKILGEGPERRRLEALCEELGVSDAVRLPGLSTDPSGELGRASLFVSCSVLEGFPMAVCEAMAAGLPVVVAEYNEGVREIIGDDDGLLVERGNLEQAAGAMRSLMADEDLRERMGRRARETAARFREEKVMGAWDGLLEELVACSARGGA